MPWQNASVQAACSSALCRLNLSFQTPHSALPEKDTTAHGHWASLNKFPQHAWLSKTAPEAACEEVRGDQTNLSRACLFNADEGTGTLA
jgi:hypothetical protein